MNDYVCSHLRSYWAMSIYTGPFGSIIILEEGRYIISVCHIPVAFHHLVKTNDGKLKKTLTLGTCIKIQSVY